MAGVRYAVDAGVARITLDRQEVRNALDLDMVTELDRSLAEVTSDPAVRLALLDAEGPAFCAGMDLKSVDLADPEQAAAFAEALAVVYLRLMTLPFPLLCAVDGPVSGGGVGLVAAADLVWAGSRARFSLPETRLGLVPALVSVPLRRRVGSRVLSGMALGGGSLDARHAVTEGLADFLAEDEAGPVAGAFARGLLREHAHEALARTKRFLVDQAAEGLERELAAAAAEFRAAAATDEARRGLEAFRRKESVRWDEH
jgi:enoyl-CoA hydratase/carnithine racemase